MNIESSKCHFFLCDVLKNFMFGRLDAQDHQVTSKFAENTSSLRKYANLPPLPPHSVFKALNTVRNPFQSPYRLLNVL
jgi:hypothetical protein